MAHSMSSLAAIESSTLLTSLVKLPSTCLLLSDATVAWLYVSDLDTYTVARCHVRACVRVFRIGCRLYHQAFFFFAFLSLLDQSQEVICNFWFLYLIHSDCFVHSSPTPRNLFFFLPNSHLEEIKWLTQSSFARMNQHGKNSGWFILQHVKQRQHVGVGIRDREARERIEVFGNQQKKVGGEERGNGGLEAYSLPTCPNLSLSTNSLIARSFR